MPVVDDDEEDVNALIPVSNIQQSLAVLVQVGPTIQSLDQLVK